ncbi:uncharacterized protein HKW66_Vig0131050 [Vigna angularis]|uniref:Glycine-rich protein n=1 Tax=Phaseolus angularis TaxID=3914 RepID=A0A8T0K205_PHAAN|nr:uncharacterized protein HKW66_Vig0131050 [Vigna angularis]
MPSKRNMSSLILCLFAIFLFVFSAVASRELKDLSNRDRRAFNGDSRLFWGGGPNYFGGYGGGYFGPYDPRFGRYPFYGGGGLNNPYGGFNNPNIGFGGLNPFGGFGNPNIGFGNPNIGGGLGNPIGVSFPYFSNLRGGKDVHGYAIRRGYEQNVYVATFIIVLMRSSGL